MRSMVRWAVSNGPGMNIFLIAILVGGAVALAMMRRETFPDFDLDVILITVPFPGATPEEVEEGVCQKIEEAVRSIDGIKEIVGTASEGSGTVTLELKTEYDPERTLDEVRSAVDRIPSFPELTEDPVVMRPKMQEVILKIGLTGPEKQTVESDLQLRKVAERLREDLLALSTVSQISISGSKDYQVDIEIPEETLRSHGMSLGDVARVVRMENIQMPGGTIRTRAREIMVRSDNRRTDGEGISQLPIISTREGAVLNVDDLGYVRDQFVDTTSTYMINKKPGLVIGVQRNTSEDIMKIIDEVNEFVEKQKAELPPGYDLITWSDRSSFVRDRLELLEKNGMQGLLIVFLLLAMFLDLRLAFWVAIGIPFSLFAAAGYLFFADQTLNMISMFAIIMALGIVVDDAIVVGENVFAHRQMGKKPVEAAVEGTAEVMPSVIAAVMTTVIAFSPLLFVAGMMGKFMAVMPVAIIAMLLASLVECVTVLPCHLAHKDSTAFHVLSTIFYVFTWVLIPVKWLGKLFSAWLVKFVNNVYMPALAVVLRWRSVFVSGCLGVLILTGGLIASGLLPLNFFPKMDSPSIMAQIGFPNGTPASVTDRWTSEIEDAFWEVAKDYERKNDIGKGDGKTLGIYSFRVIGSQITDRGHGVSSASGGGSSHLGSVAVELVDSEDRMIDSMEVVKRWREKVGKIPGTEKLSYGSSFGGPGGAAFEMRLLARAEHVDHLEAAIKECKDKLALYNGITDISDDNLPGKWELRVRVKDEAFALGVRPADLADTIRSAYYGNEVQRVQRGRHEVKIMVTYPREQRHTMASLDELRVRTSDGVERPFYEVADVEIVRGYSTIHRVDQLRSITLTADVDEKEGNAAKVVQDMKDNFLPELLERYPDVRVSWKGQQEQRAESFGSMKIGFAIAVLAMFCLLVFQFHSFAQPLIILLIVPFGLIGAVAGHLIFGVDLTFFSALGLIALSGIVINDAIVLVDFINARVHEDIPLHDAIVQAGARRFRPVMLTTLTTVGGLTPIILETSLQAKVLIPMAISIAFGEIFATILVLFLVPVAYSIYFDLSEVTVKYFRMATGGFEEDNGKTPALEPAGESLSSSDL